MIRIIFYVDDFLEGADTIEDCLIIRNQVLAILESESFEIFRD